MKKIMILLAVLACCAGLMGSVSAASGLTNLEISATVDASGSCNMAVTGKLFFDQAVAEPVFPIPEAATELFLNGQKISAPVQGSVRLVPLKALTGGRPGEYGFTLHYRLPGTVTSVQDELELKLPLLSGFAYPVESTTFRIQLPGEIQEQPVFTSSYYQELIQAQMELEFSGSTIAGSCGALKDHETVTMTLPVTQTLFPQAAVNARVMGVLDLVILGGMILALVYFLLTLRPRLFRPEPRSTPPDGVCAGDLQLWLSGRGLDLSLLVVTWAQLGYLRIQVDDSHRVLLHKRMDMGNERSSFENRYFKSLFGRRQIVDGTAEHYARLCRHLKTQTPQIRQIYRPRSGNPKLFLGLCAIPGILSGVNLANGFAPHSLFLKLLMALVIGIFSLAVQSWGYRLLTRQPLVRPIGAACALVWLVLGLLSGEVIWAVSMAIFQFLAGMAASFGGRRTDNGQQALEQILGLGLHLKQVSQEDLKRLLRANPGYFYEVAPYALALNLDRQFARTFGSLRLQECSYLISNTRQPLTAAEWSKLLRSAVQALDARSQPFAPNRKNTK